MGSEMCIRDSIACDASQRSLGACLLKDDKPVNFSPRSLIVNLVNMLSELYFPISVLGVTETKLKNDQDALLNINITGYNFLSQPSTTNAGG